jgi:hypothetical protein
MVGETEKKSTKNSVRLADIPTKFWTKHFLNTHQKVFTVWAILLDSEHNEDETLTVAVRTHNMNNLCKTHSMNKWRCAGRPMRCSVAEDLLNKLCHDIQFPHTTISCENTTFCASVNIHTYNVTGYGAGSTHLHLLPRLRMSGHIPLCPSWHRQGKFLPFLETGHSTGSHYRTSNIFLNVLKHYML